MENSNILQHDKSHTDEFIAFLYSDDIAREVIIGERSNIYLKIRLTGNIYAIHNLYALTSIDQGSNYIGLYDVKEHIIYDPQYLLRRLDNDKITVIKDDICELMDQMSSDINNHLKKIVLSDWKNWLDKYSNDADSDYWRKCTKTEILHSFYEDLDLNLSECTVKDLSEFLNPYSLYTPPRRVNIDMQLVDWLNDKESAVENIVNSYLCSDDALKRIPRLLFIAKMKYENLKSLYENSNHEYDVIHNRKKMYTALADVSGKNVTVIIDYGGNRLDFKYSREDLMRVIRQGQDKFGDYKKYYKPVSDFIKKHSENCYGKADVNIDNICEIRYGRNTVYRNDEMSRKTKCRPKDKSLERF